MAGGRPSAYDSKIKPFFDKIVEWRENGATERDIAKQLGIAWSTFKKYKSSNEEFSAILKKGEILMIQKLRGALMKKAMGYQYIETKKIYKRNDTSGQMEVVSIEETVKTAHADVAALNLALKNYDPDNWSNDPQADKFRREELELKKKALEEKIW